MNEQMADDEIDLGKVFRDLWAGRVLIIGIVFAFALLSSAYALLKKPSYESNVLLIPTDPRSSSSLADAVSFLGNKSGQGDDLDLYQMLLTCRTVVDQVFQAEFIDQSDTGRGRRVPLYRMLGVDTSDAEKVHDGIENLARAVKVGAPPEDPRGGVIQVNVKASSPWLAKQLADKFVEVGQMEIRRVRASRFETTLQRLQGAAKEAYLELDRASKELALFRSKNRSITQPEQQVDLDRYQLENDVKQQKYMMVRREIEALVLEKEKAVPPAIVLDSAHVPVRRSSPKRTMIVMLATLFGGALGCGFVIVRGAVSPSGASKAPKV